MPDSWDDYLGQGAAPAAAFSWGDYLKPPPAGQVEGERRVAKVADIFREEALKTRPPASESDEPHYDLPALQGRLRAEAPWLSEQDIAAHSAQFREQAPRAAQGKALDAALEKARTGRYSRLHPLTPTQERVLGDLPLMGGMIDFLADRGYKEAQERFQAGRATDGDINTIALNVARQERQERRTPGERVVNVAERLPAFLTEWSMLSGPAEYVGRGAAAAAVARGLPPLAARGAGFAAEVGARTALRPDVAYERAQDDGALKGVGSALLENAVWTAAGGKAPAASGSVTRDALQNAIRMTAAGQLNAEAQRHALGAGAGGTLTRLVNARTDGEWKAAVADAAAEGTVFAALGAGHGLAGMLRAKADELRGEGRSRKWVQEHVWDELAKEPGFREAVRSHAEQLAPFNPQAAPGKPLADTAPPPRTQPPPQAAPQEPPRAAPEAPAQPPAGAAPAPEQTPPGMTPPARPAPAAERAAEPNAPLASWSDEDVRALAKSLGFPAAGKREALVGKMKNALGEGTLARIAEARKPAPPAEPPAAPPAAPAPEAAQAPPGEGAPPARAGAPATLEDAFDRYGLDDRERHIIRERLKGRSHAQIAEDAEAGNVTRARVQQLEKAAMGKMGAGFSVEDFHAGQRAAEGRRFGEPHGPLSDEEKAAVRRARAKKTEDELRADRLDELADQLLKGNADEPLSEEERASYEAKARRVAEGPGGGAAPARGPRRVPGAPGPAEAGAAAGHVLPGGAEHARGGEERAAPGGGAAPAGQPAGPAAAEPAGGAGAGGVGPEVIERTRRGRVQYSANGGKTWAVSKETALLNAPAAGEAAGHKPSAAPEPAAAAQPAGGQRAGRWDAAELARNGMASAGKAPTKARLLDGSVVELANASAIGGDYLMPGGDQVESRVIKEWLDRQGNVLWRRPESPAAQPAGGAGAAGDVGPYHDPIPRATLARLKELVAAGDRVAVDDLKEALAKNGFTPGQVREALAQAGKFPRGVAGPTRRSTRAGVQRQVDGGHRKWWAEQQLLAEVDAEGPGRADEPEGATAGPPTEVEPGVAFRAPGGEAPANARGLHPNVAKGKPFAMGAAALGELTPDQPGAEPPSRTALANAQIDRERLAQGLSPILESARMQNPEAWDAALRRLEADRDYGRKLVEEVADRPRPLDVVEQAAVLHEKIRLDNEYRQTMRQMRAAQEGGGASLADLDQQQASLDALDRQRYELHRAVKRTGTELGRSLQFRRQMAAEDYSLAGMLDMAANAKGGPLTPEERADLEELHRRIQTLQDRLAEAEQLALGRKIFSPEWAGARKAKAASNEAEGDFQRQLGEWKRRRQTPAGKLADWWNWFRTNEVISAPTTLVKLADAALSQVAVGPLREAAGAAWARVPLLDRIFARAPVEGGGFRTAAELKAARGAFGQGVLDAIRTVRKGASELDELYGGKGDARRSWWDVQFLVHDALKAPAVRAAFERALQKQLDWHTARGHDVTNPVLQLDIETRAYQEGLRAKFREEAWLADTMNRVFKPGPDAGQVERFAKALGKGLLAPVVRIPTNVALRTADYIFGTGFGAARAARAYVRGIETLKPAEADAIARHFKNGTLGLALVALGYFKPDLFGGFSEDDERRRPGDTPPLAARVGGVIVPAYLTHHPLLLAGQFGATARKTERKVRKGEEEGLGLGLLAGTMGVAEEVPAARMMKDTAKAFSARERGWYFGQLLRNVAVPRLVEWLAGRADVDPATGNWLWGDPTKRKARGTWEEVKKGVPGLRPTVPAG